MLSRGGVSINLAKQHAERAANLAEIGRFDETSRGPANEATNIKCVRVANTAATVVHRLVWVAGLVDDRQAKCGR